MKHVLVVGPVPPPYGGIASVLEDIVNSDLSKDYVFEVFDRSATFPPEANGLIGKNLFRAKRFLRFFKKVRTGNYHFVHIHSPDPVFLGTTIFMLLSRLAGGKILLHVHGTDWDRFYTRGSLFRKLYTRIGLALPSKIVVLYQLWVDNVKKLCPTADVRVLRNLVHVQSPPDANEIEDVRQSLGLTKDNFVVVTVGSVGWRKGSFEILKAVPRVVSRDDSVRFTLLGGEEEPGEMAQLTAIVEAEKLEPWVRLTGELEREKVPSFLALADVFLLPSFKEGMPVTIIEAMRSGLPIISTRVAGIPDMIEDGVSGLLINPGSPEEIAEAVLRLRRDEALRAKLEAAAKVTFEEKFEFARGIQEIRALYMGI
ncbi:MAG: glycosyltransferase family 4 protein [Desulfomonilaceae bacterium]